RLQRTRAALPLQTVRGDTSSFGGARRAPLSRKPLGRTRRGRECAAGEHGERVMESRTRGRRRRRGPGAPGAEAPPPQGGGRPRRGGEGPGGEEGEAKETARGEHGQGGSRSLPLEAPGPGSRPYPAFAGGGRCGPAAFPPPRGSTL